MMHVIWIFLSAIIAYGFGMIPVGELIAKAYGRHDLRKTGSGNTGTTNVLRTLGWLPSILTLVGDATKGAIAALIGRALGGETGMLIAGLFAVLGHDFPAHAKFRGGKGMATSLGVTIIICPPVAPFLVLIVV
ncbi:MAG: glycerol-3-phosphate acyltransferase, partial [Candidatus Faecivicinus sp.]|nr:glycerol-3-phosphate acyltransferase [Candidatus Faecivicinus sp.]